MKVLKILKQHRRPCEAIIAEEGTSHDLKIAALEFFEFEP
jgi:hypothetical protein